LLAVALAVVFVFAAVYYAKQDRPGQSGPTQAARNGDAPTAPAHEAVSTPPRREDSAAEQRSPTVPEQAQLRDLDEQIRSFTIPLERAVAGMEELPLKLSIGPIPEFKETLRQFAAEGEDPAWSAAMETRIFSEISQATGLSVGDIQVDCRTTMCRVLLTKPSSAPNARYRGFNELIDSFGLKTKWILAVPDENGTPINFAYLQRVP